MIDFSEILFCLFRQPDSANPPGFCFLVPVVPASAAEFAGADHLFIDQFENLPAGAFHFNPSQLNQSPIAQHGKPVPLIRARVFPVFAAAFVAYALIVRPMIIGTFA